MATKASRIALAGSNISSTGEVDADLLDNIDSAAFLSLDSNGRLGIGTSSPSRQLEIYDDGTVGQAVLALTAQNTDYSRIMFADPDDVNIGILDYAHSDNSMRFTVNNAIRMLIGSSGNVGIGSTGRLMSGYDGNSKTLTVYDPDGSAQSGYLELASMANNDGYNAGAITFINNANSNNSAPENANSKTVAQIRAETVTSDNNAGDDAGSDLCIFTKPEAGGLQRIMTLTGSGYVGIGTNDPVEPLDLRFSGRHGIVCGSTNASGSYIVLDGAGNGDAAGSDYAYIEHTSSGNLNINVGNGSNATNTKFTIEAGGNVGIGTTNPTTKLHVSIPAIAAGTDLQKQGIVVTTPFTSGYQHQSSGLLSGYDGTLHATAIGMAYEDPGYALTFFTNDNTSGLPIERMRINDNGTLSLNYGTNGGWEGATSIPTLTINQSDTHRGIALRTVGNSNVGPTFSLERTRASGAETQHADYLGNIRFNGTTGSYIGRVAAGIEAQQRGSVVGGYAPGRLKFMTSATTATHNGQNPATGSYAARMVINPGGDQLINGQFNYHVISGTSAPNVAFQYDFYRDTYGHPMKITTAISHWNGSYMSYKEQWVWGFNTAMASRTVDEYNGGNGSWTVSFPTNNIVRVRMNGDASYSYGSGWFIKLEGNLRREFTTA